MILGEFGSIFSDILFTQTAHNGTIDIYLCRFDPCQRNFFLKFERVKFCSKEGFSTLVRDHFASMTSREN